MGKYKVSDILKKKEEQQNYIKNSERDIKKSIPQTKAISNKLVDKAELVKVNNGFVTFNGKKMLISFTYNEKIVDGMHKLANNKYNVEHKYWEAPLCLINVLILEVYGFEFDSYIKEFLSYYDNVRQYYDINNIKTPSGLSLLPFQKDTIKFIEEHEGRALISLDCGLGKSVVTSSYINNHSEIRPIVIVVPATLKYNWRNEITKWVSRDVDIKILSGKKAENLSKNTDIIIINYDILSSWVPKLIKIKPKLLICDEAHYAKGKTSNRAKACLKLADKVEQVILLTGTPIMNRVEELYNLISMVDSNIFASFYQFGQRYCGAEFNGFGWQYKGASNIDELYSLLNNIMYRKRKEEVLPELPDKRYTFIPLDLENRKEYDKAENEFIKWTKENKGINIHSSYPQTLAKMTALRQLAVLGALNYSIQWIEDYLESSDEKIVIFAIHKAVIKKLNDHFKDICVKIDGSTKQGETRQNIIDKFQKDDKIRLFIGNIQAASEGITLVASSTVVFLEMPWSPSALQQAIDRVHRIGQVKDSVNVYYLLAENTVEMNLAKLIDSKKHTITQVLDGEELKESDMLSELMGILEYN